MLFRTHLAFGVFLFLILFSFVDVWWLFGLGVLFGVLIVDLDSKKSKVGHYIFFRPFQWFVSHRGFMHSIVFGVFVVVLIGIFIGNLALGFLVGFFSHLFLDCMNKRGIALFWPLSKRRVCFFVRSGGIFEDIIFVFLLLVDVFLMIVVVVMKVDILFWIR
jgi:inner membrane protein